MGRPLKRELFNSSCISEENQHQKIHIIILVFKAWLYFVIAPYVCNINNNFFLKSYILETNKNERF